MRRNAGDSSEYARRLAEITDALEDAQMTLDVIVAHLGLREQVREAIATRREKANRSRIEIERSLGQHDADGEGRR